MAEIYNWSCEDWWGIGRGWGVRGSHCFLFNKQNFKSTMSGGEWWAHNGLAAAPIIAFSRTALLRVMVPLECTVSRIFNAKWAKIQRFLSMLWIDFLLRYAHGPIINVYLCLMGVWKSVHSIEAWWMPVPVTACLFMQVTPVHINAFVPVCVSLKNTNPWSAFWQDAFTIWWIAWPELCQ